MHRRSILPTVLVSSLALGCQGEPTAAGHAVPASLLDLSASVVGVSVEVKSEHLVGILPNGIVADVNLKVNAEGTDASSLTGEGRHFASTGAHNYWPATGSTNGTTVTLAGAVTESNVAFLIGSPVAVAADASTDAITLTFGPLGGGPFAGKTLIFTGAGKVTITTAP